MNVCFLCFGFDANVCALACVCAHEHKPLCGYALFFAITHTRTPPICFSFRLQTATNSSDSSSSSSIQSATTITADDSDRTKIFTYLFLYYICSYIHICFPFNSVLKNDMKHMCAIVCSVYMRTTLKTKHIPMDRFHINSANFD